MHVILQGSLIYPSLSLRKLNEDRPSFFTKRQAGALRNTRLMPLRDEKYEIRPKSSCKDLGKAGLTQQVPQKISPSALDAPQANKPRLKYAIYLSSSSFVVHTD
jgi:hypothetical protein